LPPEQHYLRLVFGTGHEPNADVTEDTPEEHGQPEEMQRFGYFVHVPVLLSCPAIV
jgi:hypothetical protein